MTKNAIAFLTGLGTGYMKGSENKRKEDRDEEDRALRNEASRFQIDTAKRAEEDRKTIAAAGRPVAMTEGAGGMLKPETMDNRDVALPENAALPNEGLQPGGFSVGGKAYTDRAAAQGPVDAANTPDATNNRVLAAVRGIDPVKGMAMQKDIAQNKVAETEAANTVFRNKLGVAMAGGHEGLAKFVSDTQSDGFADHQLQVVPSADGSTVTYHKVDKDGKLTPTGLTFPNNPEGIVTAAYRLDQTVTPEKRLDFALKLKKEEREGKKDDADVRLKDAQTGYTKSRTELTDATDPNAKGGGKPAVDRMSEIDKSTLGSINKQRETINTQITKAQAEGSWDDKSPGAKALQTKLASLAMQETKLQQKYAGDGGGSDGSSAPDPLNLRGKPGKTTGNMNSGREGQVDILNQELTKATAGLSKPGLTPEERVRLETDIAGLNREIARAGGAKVAIPPNMASAGVPVAARPAAAAPPMAAAPSATVPPVKSTLPPAAEAAGVQLDQARAALTQIANAPRPGLAAGRAAIDAYTVALNNAKALVQQREIEYQKLLPAQGAAFVRQQ